MSDRNKRDLEIWQSKINEFVSREKFKYLPLLIRSTSFNNRTRFNVVMLYVFGREREKDECIRCNVSLMVHTFCTDKIHTIEMFRFKNHNFLELQVSIVPIKRMHMLCIENGLRFGSFVWLVTVECRLFGIRYGFFSSFTFLTPSHFLFLSSLSLFLFLPFSFSSFHFLCCPHIHCYDRKRISSIYNLPSAFRMCNVEFVNRALCISTESSAIGNFVCLIYFFTCFTKCFHVCYLLLLLLMILLMMCVFITLPLSLSLSLVNSSFYFNVDGNFNLVILKLFENSFGARI